MKFPKMHAKDVLDSWVMELNLSTYKELANALGVSPNTLDTWKARGEIPDKWYKKFSSISLARYESESNRSFDTKLIKTISDLSASNSIIYAPIISAKASAGSGAIHYDVETVGQLMIDRMMFKILPNLQNIRAVEVSGDSMYPTLKDGDFVIIEEGEQFSGEGIYVLQFDSMLLVKRLQGSSRGIRVLSDNIYYKEDEYIPEDDQRTFQIVGKVVLRIQR